MNEKPDQPAEDRRDFLKKASAVVIGGVITLPPLIAGAIVVTDPLKRAGSGAQKIRVTNLDSLPKDGVPRKFAIVASRTDAWTRFPDAPVGAIYLRRDGESIEALNVVCPHAGCFVDFRPEKKAFLCPCHNSLFEVDGKIRDPKSPSPRALDRLLVEVRNGSEVWVEFQNYRTGTAAKIPVA
jgi:menaquinol-cytochrome c reductase iron-sulfur subunit